jgi:glycosyltransferase involved in cell wall biosynthesis
MPAKLKIAYIPTESSGVNFYRAWQPAEGLRRAGAEVALLWYTHRDVYRHPWQADLETEWAPRLVSDLEMACEWADAVVWMGLHTPRALEVMARMRRRHPSTAFLSEYDDILFKIPAENQAANYYFPGSAPCKIALEQMRLSDALLVSTPSLAAMMPHPKVYVAENTIDLRLWHRSPRACHRLTLGWVGGASHNADLALVADTLKQVVREFPQVTVKILHGCPEFLKHKDTCPNLDKPARDYDKARTCPACGGIERILFTHNFYSISNYPRWVCRHRFDIGIAPLVDNSFNRAKSNLRWLEYSAMGIPTIASPVSHFVQTIRDGDTGLLARNDKEWYQQIVRLVSEPGYRENVGSNAWGEVEKRWNPSIQAVKVKSAVEDVLNAKPNSIHTGDPDWRPDRRSLEPRMVGV